MLQFLKSAVKIGARTRFGARLLAEWLSRRFEPIGDIQAERPTVLVLNPNRWRQDLAALTRTGRFNLTALDPEAQGSVHRLFPQARIDSATEYFLETDPEIWNQRQNRVRFMRRIVRLLRDRHDIQAVITPAIHYKIDLPWCEACEAEDIPFITLHKEFTVIDERQLAERIELWRNRKFRYLGRHLCVSNENARRLFRDSGVVDESRVSVTGVMRIDNIARQDSSYRIPPDPSRPTITLFSFGHLTGPFATTDTRSHYFSRLGNEGFVELFRDVHVAFAELALANSNVRFVMKLKNHEKWWIDEIEAVLRETLDKSIAEIPNLELSTQWAPELIQRSMAVIALNSTVVLEARLLGRNTIIPVFAEAAGRYADHVYFHRYLDLFAVAASKSAVKDYVQRALRGERLHENDTARLSEMFTYYLGGDDGQAAERASVVISNCISNTGSKGYSPVG